VLPVTRLIEEFHIFFDTFPLFQMYQPFTVTIFTIIPISLKKQLSILIINIFTYLFAGSPLSTNIFAIINEKAFKFYIKGAHYGID